MSYAPPGLVIEVVYHDGQRMHSAALRLNRGDTVADAIAAISQLASLQTLGLAQRPFGIFGEICSPQRVLSPNDRLEFYRPLLKDAKAARRARAEQQKTAGR
mgnify:CR=1 FL=1